VAGRRRSTPGASCGAVQRLRVAATRCSRRPALRRGRRPGRGQGGHSRRDRGRVRPPKRAPWALKPWRAAPSVPSGFSRSINGAAPSPGPGCQRRASLTPSGRRGSVNGKTPRSVRAFAASRHTSRSVTFLPPGQCWSAGNTRSGSAQRRARALGPRGPAQGRARLAGHPGREIPPRRRRLRERAGGAGGERIGENRVRLPGSAPSKESARMSIPRPACR
jgi:hypothetical protein